MTDAVLSTEQVADYRVTRLTDLGIPVSTTHTITGAIVGVGAARRVSAVRWNIAKNIVVAWVITMPIAGVIAAIFYALATSVG
jgi:inorganic phosphate transporter, PiT family